MADLRTYADDALEALRQQLIRKGEMLGYETPGLAAVRGQLRAVAKEQTRRAEEAGLHVIRPESRAA